MELLPRRTLDVPGKRCGQLLHIGAVLAADGGDLLRGGRRELPVHDAHLPPVRPQPLVKGKQVAGVGQLVGRAVLSDKSVIEKGGIAAPLPGVHRRLVQLRPFHPGVGAHGVLRRRAVQPALVLPAVQLRLNGFQIKCIGNGRDPRRVVQHRPLRRRIQLLVRGLAAPFQHHDVRPRPGQHRQKLQLVAADIPVIEDLGNVLRPQAAHDALEFIIEPAHVLGVGVAQDALRLAPALQVLQGGVHGGSHRAPLAVRHTGQPCPQPLVQKRPVRPEVRAQHLRKIGQLVHIRVGDAPIHDDAVFAGSVIVLPDERLRLAVQAVDPAEKDALPLPPGKGEKIVIQFFKPSECKHNDRLSVPACFFHIIMPPGISLQAANGLFDGTEALFPPILPGFQSAGFPFLLFVV